MRVVAMSDSERLSGHKQKSKFESSQKILLNFEE